MLSEDMQQRGENLWNALNLTVVAWQETNAMLNELSTLMHKQLPQALRLTLQNGSSRFGWLYASAALGSCRDLREYVVTPVVSLLQGEEPEVALGSHPHAFRFQAVDERLELAEAP